MPADTENLPAKVEDVKKDGSRPDPTDDQKAFLFWKTQLEISSKAGKRSRDAAKEAWDEFVGTFTQEPTLRAPIKQPETKYPIFWASVKTIQPALYSRTPIIVSERTFDDMDDNIARLASLGIEKLGKYAVRSVPFDRVMYATRDDFILAGKSTNRVYFEADIGNKTEREYYVQTQIGVDPQTQQPMMGWINDEGTPLPPGVEPQSEQDPDNGDIRYFMEDTEETLDNVKVCLQPVNYEDILHTPNARHWEEIDWIAFKSLLTKEDVIQRFGEDVANKVQYTSPQINVDKDQKYELPVKYATIWEIWDKRKLEVLWFNDTYNEGFLDVQPDPYELQGFFPCPPFIIGTAGRDNLYPTPDYIQLRPIIFQLHGLFRRFKTLVRAIRRRGLYDASVTELAEMANEADEAEWIGVNNFAQQITAKGGIENIIQWFPVDTLVAATQQLSTVFQDYENKFNEIYGIPDILRGVTDPNETAAAQQMKGKYLSLRFSAIQREFQRLVRDSIELEIDLSLKKFPEHKLAEIMGVRYWSIEDQALFPQVLLLLQDDDERKIRVDIETDSTITMNQDEEFSARNDLATTLFEGLVQMAQAGTAVQGTLPVGAELMLYLVRGTRDGKNIEEKLRKAFDPIINPPPTPPAPPPPDPRMLDVQRKTQKDQQDFQIAQSKLQIEGQKAQGQMATDQGHLQLEAQAHQDKMGVEGAKVQLDTGKAQAQHQIDSGNLALDSKKLTVQASLDAAALHLQALHQKMSEFTRVLDDMRHAHQMTAQQTTHTVQQVAQDHLHKVKEAMQPEQLKGPSNIGGL